ncbi:MAG: transglutaminase-like domain-containing protein, partial [Opitutales bacterium]
AAAAREYLSQLGAVDAKEAFRQFIRSQNYELESGSLMLAQVADPKLDAADTYTFLEEVAGRCRQLVAQPATGWQQCRTINRVLFHEYGFAGDRTDFYNPANSFLPQVIERRRGIPITLCILYLLVAERCGLRLEPIGLPGRFMLGCFSDVEPFYIDCFEGGLFLTLEDVERRFEQQGLTPQPSFFAPCPISEVLQRCCRNLVNQYRRYEQPSEAQLFASFVHEFDLVYQRED